MLRRIVTATAAIALALAPSAAGAHPPDVDPLDPLGGHICRPLAGRTDCGAFGLAAGQYHCETDPCRAYLDSLGKTLCFHGIPVPTQSNLLGHYPTGELTPPIRVTRRPGGGHILDVNRSLFPAVAAPAGCRSPISVVGLELLSGDAGVHRANPERGAVLPLTGASVGGFERLDETPAPAPLAAAVVLGLVTAARLALRRQSYWESSRG